ncbi:Protein of unknown function [Pyronema omphalodes CBS 100304]|uniref:Uncharacterized protein n=1 Tax=Pyronema omphalodes (strain CBS 100304) TaxID=1076935 RepID=U4L978_PYROM|nr:Protein of unknown function [Pyronema omphalodes CBS 100304]
MIHRIARALLFNVPTGEEVEESIVQQAPESIATETEDMPVHRRRLLTTELCPTLPGFARLCQNPPRLHTGYSRSMCM